MVSVVSRRRGAGTRDNDATAVWMRVAKRRLDHGTRSTRSVRRAGTGLGPARAPPEPFDVEAAAETVLMAEQITGILHDRPRGGRARRAAVGGRAGAGLIERLDWSDRAPL